MSYLSDTLGKAYREGMTEEEISTALEEIANVNNNKLKTQLEKANSEAASYKKQLREKQTEDEQRAAEQAEYLKRIEAENEELKRNARFSELKASVMDICGNNDDSAKTLVTAIMDGDGAGIVSQMREVLNQNKSLWESEAIRNTPRPKTGGNTDGAVNYDSLIAEAQAKNDAATVAYYMRLAQNNSQ